MSSLLPVLRRSCPEKEYMTNITDISYMLLPQIYLTIKVWPKKFNRKCDQKNHSEQKYKDISLKIVICFLFLSANNVSVQISTTGFYWDVHIHSWCNAIRLESWSTSENNLVCRSLVFGQTSKPHHSHHHSEHIQYLITLPSTGRSW